MLSLAKLSLVVLTKDIMAVIDSLEKAQAFGQRSEPCVPAYSDLNLWPAALIHGPWSVYLYSHD